MTKHEAVGMLRGGSEFRHRRRLVAGVLFARKTEISLGGRIEHGPKIAAVAIVFAARPALRLKNAVGTAAPGTALMIFDIATGSFGKPLGGRALTTNHVQNPSGGL